MQPEVCLQGCLWLYLYGVWAKCYLGGMAVQAPSPFPLFVTPSWLPQVTVSLFIICLQLVPCFLDRRCYNLSVVYAVCCLCCRTSSTFGVWRTSSLASSYFMQLLTKHLGTWFLCLSLLLPLLEDNVYIWGLSNTSSLASSLLYGTTCEAAAHMVLLPILAYPCLSLLLTMLQDKLYIWGLGDTGSLLLMTSCISNICQTPLIFAVVYTAGQALHLGAGRYKQSPYDLVH